MMKRHLLFLTLLAVALVACKKDDDPVAPAPPAVQGDPTAIRLDSITLAGFPALNPQGGFWDGGFGTNLPDPYVEVFKNGILVYTSTVQGDVPHNGIHSMSTGAVGSLPITFGAGTNMMIKVWDNDADPNDPDFIGQLVIDNALDFFYGGDQAAGFSDLPLTGSQDVNFRLTGTFIY